MCQAAGCQPRRFLPWESSSQIQPASIQPACPTALQSQHVGEQARGSTVRGSSVRETGEQRGQKDLSSTSSITKRVLELSFKREKSLNCCKMSQKLCQKHNAETVPTGAQATKRREAAGVTGAGVVPGRYRSEWKNSCGQQ